MSSTSSTVSESATIELNGFDLFAMQLIKYASAANIKLPATVESRCGYAVFRDENGSVISSDKCGFNLVIGSDSVLIYNTNSISVPTNARTMELYLMEARGLKDTNCTDPTKPDLAALYVYLGEFDVGDFQGKAVTVNISLLK